MRLGALILNLLENLELIKNCGNAELKTKWLVPKIRKNRKGIVERRGWSKNDPLANTISNQDSMSIFDQNGGHSE